MAFTIEEFKLEINNVSSDLYNEIIIKTDSDLSKQFSTTLGNKPPDQNSINDAIEDPESALYKELTNSDGDLYSKVDEIMNPSADVDPGASETKFYEKWSGKADMGSGTIHAIGTANANGVGSLNVNVVGSINVNGAFCSFNGLSLSLSFWSIVGSLKANSCGAAKTQAKITNSKISALDKRLITAESNCGIMSNKIININEKITQVNNKMGIIDNRLNNLANHV